MMNQLMREIVRSSLMFFVMICILFGAAVLTACSTVKYVAHCTLLEPENCN